MSINELMVDKQLLEELKVLLIEILTKQGVDKMFEGVDVSHFADAKMAIDTLFEKLDDMSGLNESKVINNSSR